MKRFMLLLVVAALLVGAVIVAILEPWRPAPSEVTIYTSVDQAYAEPILDAFKDKTGIRVTALYDAEAAKTVGLTNRLIAEKAHPLADVFWNGEFMQTLALEDEGVLAPYASPFARDLPPRYVDIQGAWTAFGGRARVIIVNTDRLPPEQRPDSIFDLLDRPGEVAIANPLFGSTASHAAALAAVLGLDQAYRFFADLKAGGARFVDGNAVVRDLVAAGTVSMGLTDTDDACVAIKNGAPVIVILPDQQARGLGTLIMPNSVALIAGAPHPEAGRALIDFLLAPETESALLTSGWFQVPSRSDLAASPCYDAVDLFAMPVTMPEIRAQRDAIDSKLEALMQN